MKNFRINHTNKTVEMSERFSNAASNPYTREYKELIEVKNVFPTYEVVVVESKKSNNKCQKGLNIDYMKSYIEKHNDSDNMIIIESLINGKVSFFEIKAKFVELYPIFKTLKTQTEILLAE